MALLTEDRIGATDTVRFAGRRDSPRADHHRGQTGRRL